MGGVKFQAPNPMPGEMVTTYVERLAGEFERWVNENVTRINIEETGFPKAPTFTDKDVYRCP